LVIKEDEIYKNDYMLPLRRIVSLSNSLSLYPNPFEILVLYSTDLQNPTFSEDVGAPADIVGGEHPLDLH